MQYKTMDERRGEYFGDVPGELDVEYAMYLDYDDIINLCRTQRSFRNLCENDQFWREKTEYELSKYENDYEPSSYMYEDGDAIYNYTPLPQDLFLREAIEREEYHYIKHLLEMFGLTQESIGFVFYNLQVKNKAILHLLWDELELAEKNDPEIQFAFGNEWYDYITGGNDEISDLAILMIMKKYPLDNMNIVFSELIRKRKTFQLNNEIIAIILAEADGVERLTLYFEYFPQYLREYIINNYRHHSLEKVELILNNFLVFGWSNKIRLPNYIIDELIELKGESNEILESWRE